MYIEVDHTRWHEQEWRHPQHLLSGDEPIAGTEGPGGLIRVLATRNSPATTYVDIPDSDLEQMVADHELAVSIAARGYRCLQEGGAGHGEERNILPRQLPRKALHQLVAEHLQYAVLPAHCRTEHVTAVRVTEAATLTDAQRNRVERYLNDTLVLP